MDSNNLQLAIRHKERFENYLLGLIFAILGLSVQTAKFGVGIIPDTCELLAWVALLVAGLAGLSRAEWVPELYRRFSIKDDQEEKVRAAQSARLQGAQEFHVMQTAKTVSVIDYIAGAKEGAAAVDAAIAPLKRSVVRKYSVMRAAFLIGISLLMVSRGFVPARGVVLAIKTLLTLP